METSRQVTDADLEQAREKGYARFSGWGLASLPARIAELGDLERMYLVHNELTMLPRNISHLINLTELDVRQNQLTELPEELGDLSRLEELYLDDNLITALPPEIGKLRRLRILDLDGNKLTALPPEIGELRELEQLDLRNNALAELPAEIGKLTNLRRLYLQNNQLSSLPPEIGRLTQLDKLELDQNRLTGLPREMVPILTRPISLRMGNNPFDDPLPDLIPRGWEAVAAFLRSLEDAVPHYEAKLLVVGEGNVGKTSLVAALNGEPFVENRETTHGLQIAPLMISHPDLNTDILARTWDFGGQEIYRITHQFFFSRRALYLVVWNAREGQEQDDVEGWLRRIRLRVGRESRAILIATHCDERHPEIDFVELDRAFPGMLAGEHAIDSRSRRGIGDLRSAIAREAAGLPQMGRFLSPRWIAARDDILARYQSQPQISYDEFATACRGHGLGPVLPIK